MTMTKPEMNEAALNEFKALLLRQKAELLELEESSKDATRPVELDQASVGRLSRMDAMQSQEMAQEASRRRQQQLARIEGALRRIEAGEYGLCFRCGEEIDARRLALDPTLTRCMRCAD
jgi:DnaK suppressor protein